ncbi:MAG: VIT family protein [Patescibacteria group bacterium]
MDLTKKERSLLLRVVQPGLAGLMDGSVSTLAPLFAAAYATGSSHTTFLIGASAATGAGISMAFAEALSDSGEITGRGHPIRRGFIIGSMTFLGGILHTLPFLISNLSTALLFAYTIAGFELIAIAYIRRHFFKMNFFYSVVQVILGGGLVLAAGLLIGSA